ncbi:hypothetical protein GCM10022237_37690 [Nocardioides ginsengisoli]
MVVQRPLAGGSQDVALSREPCGVLLLDEGQDVARGHICELDLIDFDPPDHVISTSQGSDTNPVFFIPTAGDDRGRPHPAFRSGFRRFCDRFAG